MCACVCVGVCVCVCVCVCVDTHLSDAAVLSVLQLEDDVARVAQLLLKVERNVARVLLQVLDSIDGRV